jgi:hypothetical protein
VEEEKTEKIKLLKAAGRFKVTHDFIRVILDADFCRYYRAFFHAYYYNTVKLQIPKHGAHINIVSGKLHPNADCKKYSYLNGKVANFYYDIRGNMGGFSKGFKNFWLDVYSKEFEEIAQDLGCLKDQKGFAYFHITIGNNKNLIKK